MPALSPAWVTESPSVSLCLMPLPGPRWPRARAQAVPEAVAQLRGQRAPCPPQAGPAATAGPPASVSRPRPLRSPSACLSPPASSREAFFICLLPNLSRPAIPNFTSRSKTSVINRPVNVPPWAHAQGTRMKATLLSMMPDSLHPPCLEQSRRDRLTGKPVPVTTTLHLRLESPRASM